MANKGIGTSFYKNWGLNFIDNSSELETDFLLVDPPDEDTTSKNTFLDFSLV